MSDQMSDSRIREYSAMYVDFRCFIRVKLILIKVDFNSNFNYLILISSAEFDIPS